MTAREADPQPGPRLPQDSTPCAGRLSNAHLIPAHVLPQAFGANRCDYFLAGVAVAAAAGATFGVVLASFLVFFECFLATGVVVVEGLFGVLLAGA